MEIKDKVRALRLKLGLSQEALAERCGFPQHNYVSRTESGGNQLSRQATRRAYARGFGLSPDDFDRFLDGDMSVDEAAVRADLAHVAPEPKSEPRVIARGSVFDAAPVSAPHTHDLAVLERALFAAMDGNLHEPADFDIAREVVRASYRYFPVEVLPQTIAEQLLAAASSLREDGLEVTITSVLARSHPVDESARSTTRPKVVLESSGSR